MAPIPRTAACCQANSLIRITRLAPGVAMSSCIYPMLRRLREASPAALQDSRERRLVHAVLDGHFDRILILSPICPRDLR
jgi:hypothetical protein